MNVYEKAVYECMDPTEALLERTTNPLHRAMLFNFWRHVHLEGSGQFDKIVADDMMVDHPVYRVSWGANPVVVEGKQGVKDFYSSIGEVVLWNSDDIIAVSDAGVFDELTFHQLAKGADLMVLNYGIENPDGLYLISSRQMFFWPYDSQGRLAGEHLYEDKTSLKIVEVDPSVAITPERVREIHREELAKLEERFGPNYWVYKG